ncbi:MAG: hypothetical protein WBL67_21730 [Nitrososphaeraceae archaeon]
MPGILHWHRLTHFTAFARCAADELATGGGTGESFSGNTVNPGPVRDFGTPDANPTMWQFEYSNPGPSPVNLQAFAECAKLVDVP